MAKKPQAPLAPAAKKRGETLQQQTVARQDLAAYNASQSPRPHPAVRLGGSGSGGAGILSARGAGSGGGSGEGGSGGGPDLDMPAAGIGGLKAALQKGLLEPKPYREEEGPRRSVVQPRAVASNPAAQAMLGVNGSGYNAGVMTTKARQRAMGQADSLGLDTQTRASMQGQILDGDYGVTGRAAQAIAGVDPSALQRGGVQAYLRQMLLEGGADHRAKKAADQQRYSAVAQRNTERAQANSSQALKMGMAPTSGEGQLQAELRNRLIKSYPSADLKGLQGLALQGDVDAAKAIEGGVRQRDRAHEQNMLTQRYVMPAQINAAGKAQDRDARIKVAEMGQQAAIYKAQMQAAGLDAQTQSRMLNAYNHANGQIIAAGGDPIPWATFHSQASQMAAPGQVPQPGAPQPPGPQPQPGMPQAAQAPSPVSSRPLVAAQSPQVQSVLTSSMSAEEWARFDQMPPADQQAFLNDVAAGRFGP